LVLLEYTYDKSEIYGQDYKDNITFLWVTNKNTFGRGWAESNGVAKQAGTTIFVVRVVIDLTLLSRSFFSTSFWDTQEGSDGLE
jgi:hypothetical protein